MTTDQTPAFIPAARPVIGEEEIEAAVRVLRSGRVVQGPEVAAFEDEFSKLVDGRHCVAVNAGTSALHLSLVALGIGAGDEVIVPSFTFAATANAVALVGAKPVFADIDADTFCLDAVAVAAAITPRTAAIMSVDLYGHPADKYRLGELAERHGLAVIEDAARAHGAEIVIDAPSPAGIGGKAVTAAGWALTAYSNFSDPRLSTEQKIGRTGATIATSAGVSALSGAAAGAAFGTAAGPLGMAVGFGAGAAWTVLDNKFGVSKKIGDGAADAMKFGEKVGGQAVDTVGDGIDKVGDGVDKVTGDAKSVVSDAGDVADGALDAIGL